MRRQRASCRSSAHLFLAAAALLSFAAARPVAAHAQPAPTSSVDDFIKPLHRVDIRLEYQRQNGGVDSWTSTLRYQRPFELNDGWKVTFRADLPLPVNNDNPAQTFIGGVGDLLMQTTLPRDLGGDNGYGFALRMIAPTASDEAFGGGRWRLLPTVGVQLGLPGISPGSFFQPVVRYQFDFAGDPGRNHYSDLQFAPSLNIALPRDAYVTLFPSTDIRYNFVHQEWFVPFNIEIGKQWGRNIVTSLELGVPIYYEARPVYLFKLEGRLTMLF